MRNELFQCSMFYNFYPPTDSNNNLHFSFKFNVGFWSFHTCYFGIQAYLYILNSVRSTDWTNFLYYIRPIICGVKYFDYYTLCLPNYPSRWNLKNTNGNDIDKMTLTFSPSSIWYMYSKIDPHNISICHLNGKKLRNKYTKKWEFRQYIWFMIRY